MTKSTTPKPIRELSGEDRRRLEDLLTVFRTEFACWQDMFSNDWDVLEFAQYEGVTSAPRVRAVLDQTEGLVLGEKCVALYECQWCMVKVGDQWHVAIRHSTLGEPIDVSQFNRKKLDRQLPKAWLGRLFKPPAPRKAKSFRSGSRARVTSSPLVATSPGS